MSKRPTFTVGRRSYDLIGYGELTVNEQLAIRAECGIGNVRDINDALEKIDIAAWRSLLLASMRRAAPRTQDTALDEENLIEIVNSLTSLEDEEDDGPPAETGVDQSETTPDPSTLDAGGPPPTPTTSVA